MNDIISPDVIEMLLLAFGFAGLVLAGDWLIKRLQRRGDSHIAAE